MTHSEVMSQPTEETSRQAPLRSGNKRGTLALLLSVIALGRLFYPAIRQGVITVAGPQRWLPAQLPYVSRLPAGPDAKLLAADLAGSVSVLEEQLANLEASIAELREAAAANTDAASIQALEQRLIGLKDQFVALDARDATSDVEVRNQFSQLDRRLADLANTDAAGIQMLEQRLTGLKDQFVALDARDATSDVALKNQISKLDQRLADTAAPEMASLLAARLALLSISRGLRPDDLDAITAAAAADPAMSDIVAKLKVLAEQNIPPTSLLRERFPALAHTALRQATREQLGWWDSSVFAVRSSLSDLGVGVGADESKDSLVIDEANKQLDLGRLQQALFEIDGGSPELKSILSGWINDARQRLAIDDGLLQLVNLLLMRVTTTSAAAGAG